MYFTSQFELSESSASVVQVLLTFLLSLSRKRLMGFLVTLLRSEVKSSENLVNAIPQEGSPLGFSN